MDGEQLYSHIGNVVRLAALIQASEVQEICSDDQLPSCEMLLAPASPVATEADRMANAELLRAFQSFHEKVVDVAAARFPPPETPDKDSGPEHPGA